MVCRRSVLFIVMVASCALGCTRNTQPIGSPSAVVCAEGLTLYGSTCVSPSVASFAACVEQRGFKRDILERSVKSVGGGLGVGVPSVVSVEATAEATEEQLRRDRSVPSEAEAEIVQTCRTLALGHQEFLEKSAVPAETPNPKNAIHIGGDANGATITQTVTEEGAYKNERMLRNARNEADAALQRAAALGAPRRCGAEWRNVTAMREDALEDERARDSRSAGEIYDKVKQKAEQIARELDTVDLFNKAHSDVVERDRARDSGRLERERQQYGADSRELEASFGDMKKYLDGAAMSRYRALVSDASALADAASTAHGYRVARAKLIEAFNLLQWNAHQKNPAVYIYFERSVSVRPERESASSKHRFPRNLIISCAEELSRLELD